MSVVATEIILIRGARPNNLEGVDVDIPTHRISLFPNDVRQLEPVHRAIQHGAFGNIEWPATRS